MSGGEGISMRRVLIILVLSAIALVPVLPTSAAEIQPQMAGWERNFTVTWEPGTYRGKPVVEGYVNNVSPYSTRSIRLLVDSLDAAGNVTNQRVEWLAGDLLGGGRLFFQVPAAPAPSYRVRVFSYDRIEVDGPMR
jgi:hypothetical protein